MTAYPTVPLPCRGWVIVKATQMLVGHCVFAQRSSGAEPE